MQMSRVVVLALITTLGCTGPGLAQTERIGPGGIPMAPGPSQPRDFTPGGIGPGRVPVAPGPAARDTMIERVGPGGVPLAPGPAGSVDTRPGVPNVSAAPFSRDLSTTVRAKRRPVYRGKSKKRRPRPGGPGV